MSSLIGRSVCDPHGLRLGRVTDGVVQLGEKYPRLAGLVIRVGKRRIFLPHDHFTHLNTARLYLSGEQVDLTEFQQRPGEVLLMNDIVDRQVVDINGVQVIRCSDALLAQVNGQWALVAADVSMATLWRRLISPHHQNVPRQVIDWSMIATFIPGQQVHLDTARSQLPRLRAAELADLLEDLNGRQREELLDSLSPQTGADAVEEMGPAHVRDLLTSLPIHHVVRLLENMEPDEAVDALRDLPPRVRDDLITQLPHHHREELSSLLRHDPRTAGALMTPRLVTTSPPERVDQVCARMGEYLHTHGPDLQCVVVTDDQGRVIGDVSAIELAVASAHTPIGDVVHVPGPITVTPDSDLTEVVSALRDNRTPWLIVVDEHHHPVGRIEADDIIDALQEEEPETGLLWRKRS